MGVKTPNIDLRDSLVGNNLIINGDMTIAQRGTSFAAAASGVYGADRFPYYKVGAMVHTITQDTDVPTFAESGYNFKNSLRLNLTTPDDSIATGDYCFLAYSIEGYDFRKIAGKPFTLSFWVKATTTGIYSISCRNTGADRSIVKNYTINSANTWEKKTLNFAASPSTGTWDYTNGQGLYIRFPLSGGTTLQTSTLDSWQTGNYTLSSTSINGTATGSTDFRITGVMLNEGSEALPFSLAGNNYANELALCQRYYERHTGVLAMAFDNANSTTSGQVIWQYKVKKRANATNSVGSTMAANSRYYGPSGLRGISTFVTGGISNVDAGGFTVTLASAAVQYQGGTIAIIANGATDYLDADAEL